MSRLYRAGSVSTHIASLYETYAMSLFKNKYRVETTRLMGWDYAAVGWYFVTICTRNREYFFGEVEGKDVRLSAAGDMAAQCWREIPIHFPHAAIDEFIVMPNHVHGIVVIERTVDVSNVETRHTCPDPQVLGVASLQKNKFGPLKRGSVSKIIQAYKAVVTKWCHANQYPYFDWQPRFYDHIVRDDKGLAEIREYIVNNPAQWDLDRNKTSGVWM